MDEYTTITIKKETRERLTRLKSLDPDFKFCKHADDVIDVLIDEYIAAQIDATYAD